MRPDLPGSSSVAEPSLILARRLLFPSPSQTAHPYLPYLAWLTSAAATAGIAMPPSFCQGRVCLCFGQHSAAPLSIR